MLVGVLGSMTTTNQLTFTLLSEAPRRMPNLRLWRNNTGGGVGMATVKQAVAAIHLGDHRGAVYLLSSRPVKFGLEGSADLSGIMGPSGRRVEIEVKAGRDKQSMEQQGFQGMITALGGIYLVARDAEECLRELEVLYRGEGN